LEDAGEIYKQRIKPSAPDGDHSQRIELYATFGLALRSTMYPAEPERRTL
jgi:hypothetical protein